MIPIVGFALTFVWWPSMQFPLAKSPEKLEDTLEDQNLPQAEMVHLKPQVTLI